MTETTAKYQGPAQALRANGFTCEVRTVDATGDIVMHWQRARTHVRLVVVPRGGFQIGAPGTWTATLTTPGKAAQSFATGGTADGEAQAMAALVTRIAR